MKTKECLLLFAALAGSVSLFAAPPKPSVAFGDHMVLQRDRELTIPGVSVPGDRVTVTLAGKTFTGTADDQGNFKVKVGPFAAGGPYELTLTGQDGTTTIKDLLVGEVWMCSGQSNMQWAVQQAINGAEEVKNADYPQIRHFLVPRVVAATPQKTVKAEWKVASPDTVTGVSAVGFFFARELYKALNVPIGILSDSWSGTRIEPWIPLEELQESPQRYLQSQAYRASLRVPGTRAYKAETALVARKYEEWIAQYRAAAAAGKEKLPAPPTYFDHWSSGVTRGHSTAIYNAMVAPLEGFPVRGSIWYQGEANIREPMLYPFLLDALIKGWKRTFDSPEMAFYLVQLAPFNGYTQAPTALPTFWEMQQRYAEKNAPSVGMAVINDVGDINDIHPKNKQDVAKRLAKLALKRTYGQDIADAEFPAMESVKFNGADTVISFRNVKEWKTSDGKAPDYFEVAGEDGIFAPADAVIDGASIRLTSAKVQNPCQVRFAWNKIAEPNLRTELGLPLGAFRYNQPPTAKDLTFIPDGEKYAVIFKLNLLNPKNTTSRVQYDWNYSCTPNNGVKRVGYYVDMEMKDGSKQQLFVTMDPFQNHVELLGVPDFETGAPYQGTVRNAEILSNVPGIINGKRAEIGLEFWCCNYDKVNTARIPGASNEAMDFGDNPKFKLTEIKQPGYGSMQIHDFTNRTTLFAYNAWMRGTNPELGIGNAPAGSEPDWTFSNFTSSTVKSATLYVVAEWNQ
ncbi:MAG: hypothetical protein J6R85_04480 [Lentisphaeria bacterium]|nr:hypothetical protein [Lentisphaeria bacterium]